MTRDEMGRMIPVKLGPPHAGLVVLFTEEEYANMWADVDPEVCDQLERNILGIKEEGDE